MKEYLLDVLGCWKFLLLVVPVRCYKEELHPLYVAHKKLNHIFKLIPLIGYVIWLSAFLLMFPVALLIVALVVPLFLAGVYMQEGLCFTWIKCLIFKKEEK